MARAEQNPEPSRLLLRLLDPDARLDYVWIALMAIWPIVCAYLVGAAHSHDRYHGYVVWENLNWTSYVLLLPLTLFLVRWAINRIAPAQYSLPKDEWPPIVQLVHSPHGRLAAYDDLRSTMFSKGNALFAIFIVVLFHAFDLRELLVFYLGMDTPTDELDWAVMFVPGLVPKSQNLLLVASAYPLQVFLVFLLSVLAVLITRHNVFFLQRVYQRRRVPEDRASAYIAIDLDDVDNRFGFGLANRAFNVQVMLLSVTGIGLLVSRYSNIGADGLFRDAGQIGIALGWLAGLVIVTLPAFVKFLPLLPGKGAAPEASVVGYMREFIPPKQWRYKDPPEQIVVTTLTARFAINAFWPTGNNKAAVLFFFSFFVLCLLLVPNIGILLGEFESTANLANSRGAVALISTLAYAGIAYALTSSLLFIARIWLGYIDARLVKPPSEPPMSITELDLSIGIEKAKADVGVFISYRRRDTAAYTGRIEENLRNVIDKKRIFYDLHGVDPGTDFVDKIDRAIAASDVMLVVIGMHWLSMTDEKGRERAVGGPSRYVRLEIETALRRGLPIIPVLVGGATMPEAGALPAELVDLARLQAVEITDSRWEYDFGILVDGIMKFGKQPTQA